MKRVGVRDLKNKLSLYLQYVKEGETIIVTEHNKAIAEINVPDKTLRSTGITEKLKQLSKEGEVILARRNTSCVKLPQVTEKIDWITSYSEARADRI
jgi:antitoxin (DNA-binding transcriptional repressor) of toxin-antitoxin stability system